MQSYVVYDSHYGNTAQVAEAIAAVLREAGPVEIGPAGYMAAPVPGTAGLLVVGAPTQDHRESSAMGAWLDRLEGADLTGLPVLAFDTRYRKHTWLTGSAARRIAARLRAAGAALLGGPVSFFVAGPEGPLEPGEIEQATAWARAALATLAAAERAPAPAPAAAPAG